MKKIFLLAALLCGCARDSEVISKNLSYAADKFEIMRRVVFYNGITGDYILSVEGLCAIFTDSRDTSVSSSLAVVCKVGNGQFKKHFLGLSDNVTYFAEQLDGANADPYHYRVVFKPSVILPSIEMK